MALTTPPTIDPAPTAAPQRGDRATFSGRVDAFVTWLTAAVAQFGAVASNVYANGQDVYTQGTAITSAASASASAAETSAANAAASATAATASANATPWVSGTTYAQNAAVISQINFRTYRRKTASGSGTTDPSLDPTNYVLVSNGPVPRLKVSHRLSNGVGGGTSASATWNTRPLNVTDTNTIPGASIASNIITLPAGTYRAGGRSAAANAGAHQTRLYNVTDAAVAVIGGNASTAGANVNQTDSHLTGEFTITATKTFRLDHYTTTGAATVGLGNPVSAGIGELYAELIIDQIG